MSNEHCILNGKIIRIEESAISPFDRGFMYGDGVFDTMFAPKGAPFLFEEHIRRLFHDLNFISISMPYTAKELNSMIAGLIKSNGLIGIDAVIRTTVTRGLNSGGIFYESDTPTLLITAAPVQIGVSSARENGVSCVISEAPRGVADPISRIKSLNFLWSVMGAKFARGKGADECIFFNSDGFVAEASTSNIFIIKENIVKTPPVDAGILPGVTRDYIIKLLQDNNISVSVDNVTRKELFEADEVFLTSSVRGVTPVQSIGSVAYKSDFTKRIYRIYSDSISLE